MKLRQARPRSLGVALLLAAAAAAVSLFGCGWGNKSGWEFYPETAQRPSNPSPNGFYRTN
ncbi:MAG: hypothetical protein AAF411_16125 [Myxococcota bacterium]